MTGKTVRAVPLEECTVSCFLLFACKTVCLYLLAYKSRPHDCLHTKECAVCAYQAVFWFLRECAQKLLVSSFA